MERIYMWLTNSLLFLSIRRTMWIATTIHTHRARSLDYVLSRSIKLPSQKKLWWRKKEHVGMFDSIAGHMFGIWRGNCSNKRVNPKIRTRQCKGNDCFAYTSDFISIHAEQSRAEQSRAGDSVVCDGPNTNIEQLIRTVSELNMQYCCWWGNALALSVSFSLSFFKIHYAHSSLFTRVRSPSFSLYSNLRSTSESHCFDFVGMFQAAYIHSRVQWIRLYSKASTLGLRLNTHQKCIFSVSVERFTLAHFFMCKKFKKKKTFSK